MKPRRTGAIALALFLACLAPNPWAAAQSSNARKNKPASPSTSHTLLVYADADCDFSIDGESPQRIIAGQPTKVPIDLGQHIVICSAEDNYKQTQQITIGSSDPKQTIFNISLAQQIASSKALKKQEDDAAAEKAAVDREQQATQDAKDNLVKDKLRRLTGSWVCRSDEGLGSAAGQSPLFVGGLPQSTTVAVMVSRVLQVRFDSTANLSGSYQIDEQERIATLQERAAKAGPSTYFPGVADICFVRAGGCVGSAAWSVTYDISGYQTDETGKRIYLKLGEGQCTGDCSRDTHIPPGRKTEILKFPEGNPGFYIGGSYCQR